MKAQARTILGPAVFGAGVVLLWYGVRHVLDEDSRFLLPTPGQVIAAIAENAPTLAHATLNTATGALLGLGIAVALSFALGLAMSFSRLLRAALYPYLMILQMMPVIVIAPILVLWVGAGLKSVTIITVLVCFFPLVVSTTQGLISTDEKQLELFAVWRTSRWQQFRHLRLPAALPSIFTGMRIAAVLAPIGALVGDYTAGSSAGDGGGLGFQAIIYSSQAQYPALFATAAVTCVLGFIFTGAVVALSWAALHRWHDSYVAAAR
jgi:NitT/TauT family transport system permease protein